MKKPIKREDTIEFGYIKKTHGVKGELLIVYQSEFDDMLEDLKYLFFEVDGLLVPFFIENMKFRSDYNANTKFEFIDSQDVAQPYIGTKLFIPSELAKNVEADTSPRMLIGYKLIDNQIGVIGDITDVNDFNSNFVLSVNYHNNEILVPLAEELILSLEEDTKTIVMNCPNGLFDIEA